MRYLLDTNICIYIIKNHPPQVIHRLRSCGIGDVAVSSITLAELEYGAAKSSRPEQNREALLVFASPLEILPFDDDAALHYGDIWAHLGTVRDMVGRTLRSFADAGLLRMDRDHIVLLDREGLETEAES